MIVNVSGGNEIWNKEIEKFTRAVMQKLMPRAYTRLYLTIELEYGLHKNYGVLGDCEIEILEERPSDFIIRLEENSTDEEVLITLAHELVHVQQYASGKLKQYMRGGYRFKNDIYPNEYPYMLRPWEIEADTMEKDLYDSFIN